MTFLCFLGALQHHLVALCVGLMVLCKVYGIALSMINNVQAPQGSTFYYNGQFTGEKLLRQIISITKSLCGYSQHPELREIATGGD